jgi:hypothetical protein
MSGKCVASTFYILNKGKYYFLVRPIDSLTSNGHVYSVLPYAFRQTDMFCLLKIIILLVPFTLPALRSGENILLEKPTVIHFIKKFTTVYEIRSSFAVFIRACYWSLSELNEFSRHPDTLLRSIFIFFSLRLVVVPSDLSSYIQILELKFCSLVSSL